MAKNQAARNRRRRAIAAKQRAEHHAAAIRAAELRGHQRGQIEGIKAGGRIAFQQIAAHAGDLFAQGKDNEANIVRSAYRHCANGGVINAEETPAGN